MLQNSYIPVLHFFYLSILFNINNNKTCYLQRNVICKSETNLISEGTYDTTLLMAAENSALPSHTYIYTYIHTYIHTVHT